LTAPAVVRRWNDPPPARVDRSLPDRPVAADPAKLVGDDVRARVRERLVRMWRVAPFGAVLLSGLVAHVGIAPHLAVRGAAPDVLLVAVVAVAVRRGSRTGAGFGFAAGLGADIFLATPLGTSALAYTLVGHVLGRSRRSRASASASALCSPDSTCFACRTGRLHRRPAVPAPARYPEPAAEPPIRPSRVRRRAAARRAALRRSIVLTAIGVAAGRLGTAAVATTLGGVPFPAPPGLVQMAAVALLSAPLGPLTGAVAGRLGRASGGLP